MASRRFSRGIEPVLVWQIQGIVITVFAIALVLLSSRMRRPLAEELIEGDSRSEPSRQAAPQPAP